jgi:hypothetical protein
MSKEQKEKLRAEYIGFGGAICREQRSGATLPTAAAGAASSGTTSTAALAQLTLTSAGAENKAMPNNFL